MTVEPIDAATEGEAPAPKPKARSPRGPRNRRRVVLRWIKRGLLVALAIAGAVAIVQAMIPKPVPVDLVSVAQGPMVVTVDEDGRARVKDRYVLSAPLTGRVDRLALVAGDQVKEGAVVARIVPLDAPLMDDRSRSTAEARVAQAQAAMAQTKAQIERAKAQREFAVKEAKRMRELRAEAAIPEQRLEQALLAERSAAAELESAKFAQHVASHELRMTKAALGRYESGGTTEQLEVPSPITGQVLRVIQQSEGVVQPGTPLLELGDPTALEIVVDVLTRDAVKIQPGAKVTIDRWGGEPLEGRVHRVEPSAFSRVSALGVEEQRVNVLIDLVVPREQWAALGDGYRVEAHMVVWEDEAAVHVPASAVFRHDDGWAVYRVEAGRVALQPVTIGERNGREVQILEGLVPGGQVVAHPSDRIREGTEVVGR